MIGGQAVRLQLLRQEETAGYMHLLVVCVAYVCAHVRQIPVGAASKRRTRKMHDLATVQQRRGDGLQSVRSAYEEYLAQIDWHVHIMILHTPISYHIPHPTHADSHGTNGSAQGPTPPAAQPQGPHGSFPARSCRFRPYTALPIQHPPSNDTHTHEHTYRRMTGSGRPAFLRACTMLPGPLATYVRRCPLISPSSRTPPSEMRWNGLSSARAMDCPSDVLPVPGGPTNLTQ